MNVIPESATIKGTCRALNREVQDMIEARVTQLASGIATAHGLTAEVIYDRRYPVLVNSEEETHCSARAAAAVVGAENVDTDHPPTMGSEDFAWMLLERSGAYIRVGNGEGVDGGCVVHNSRYDFNDKAAVYGASYWAELVEQELPLG